MINQNSSHNFLFVISFLFLLIIVTCPTSYFCFPLCASSGCNGQKYNDCSSCRTGIGFNKFGGGSSQCVRNWADSSRINDTTAKWEPSAQDQKISASYDMKNSFISPLQVLTLSPSTVASCGGKGQGNYQYYGDLKNTDILTITHPGVSPDVFFWQVQLIYAVIFIEQGWNASYSITTKFLSNASQPNKSDSMSNNSRIIDACFTNLKQQYHVIIHTWTYANTSLSWEISTTNTDPTARWGVLNIIVSVRLCHPYCTVCNGDGWNKSCTACNYQSSYGAKLSGTTCYPNCTSGYGDNTTNPSVCIDCVDTNCAYCFDFVDNCLGCISPYLLYSTAANIVSCVIACPDKFLANRTGNDTCVACDPICYNCSGSITNCTSCNPTFYLYQQTCWNPCPAQTYPDSPTQKCIPCLNLCTVCAVAPNNCSVCDISPPYKSYLKDGTTCLTQCGGGYFQFGNGGVGPNLCEPCDTKCSICDVVGTNCSACNPTFYLLGNICDFTCPFPQYFTDDATWKCLDCTTYCVNMTMTLRWKNSLKEVLICDLQFTQSLSWGPTEIQAFLKVSIDDPILDINSFNFVYEAITPKIMRLTLSPKSYTFIYNVTFNFKTIALDLTQYHFAVNGYRFSDGNYGVQKSMLWFLIKAPSLSENEKTIMDSVAKFSDKIQAVTTLPYMQEIKKAGVFALLMGGAQATSTAVLVNTIPSQNFYEGVRFWASFVFFDVPPWQQNSQKTKYFVVPNVNDLIKSSRLLKTDTIQNKFGTIQQIQNPFIRILFDTAKVDWRFQRTGHTSFFVFDTYMNFLLIVLCWILLGISKCMKHSITKKRIQGLFYSFTIKVHEITIFYISLSTLLEWIYFESSSIQRWVSLGFCILFNIYFLFYELYIYYQMIGYPAAQIGNQKYDFYVVKYGSLLKNIRFQQYDSHQQWSITHWFRPYNYHIMSYYKKFLMMIALPIFYQTQNAQILTLMAIQVMEIIRFCIIRPFHSTVRNLIRLFLQICLFAFFFSIFVQALKMKQIMSAETSTIADSINMFYTSGWVGFCLVFLFNIGHIIIWIYDIAIGCKKSNREMMDEIRKFYYMRRVKAYEQQNQDIPIEVLNKWVKLGNLNDRKLDDLPDLNLRIEYFKIMKSANGYQIDMQKLLEIFLNVQFNYQKENNLTAGKKLNKRFTLTRSLSPTFYSLIQNLYREYINQMDFEYMIIKTFQKVVQSSYKPGERIILNPEIMEQAIVLQTFAGQTKQFRFSKLLPGFPISFQDLRQLF